MINILEYKGYHSKIEFNISSKTLRGIIIGINDYVDFETDDLSKVEAEFHSAVDDYIEFCKEVGKEPEKEYKGAFNVRVTPALHKQLALRAEADGETLNAAVVHAITQYVAMG